MPAISVIVPVYQVEAYLPRCVDSILAQSFTDFELILVDDGSPDGCGAICDRYAAEDPRVIALHRRNRGVSAARNAGISCSRAKWLMFCDADDAVTPDWAETMYGYAEQYPDRLVNCEFYQIEPDGSCAAFHLEQYAEITSLDEKDYALNWDRHPFWFVWNRIFSSETIREQHLRFEEDVGNGEDVIFVIAYLRAIGCKMLYVPKPYYYWINNDGCSASRKYDPHRFDKLCRTYQARKTIIPAAARQGLYNKEFYLMLHECLLPALCRDDAEYGKELLRDPLFRELVRKSDSVTAPVKLKLLLLTGNYKLVKAALSGGGMENA